MCYGCWEEYGKPSVVTPEIIAAAALVKPLYDISAVGGKIRLRALTPHGLAELLAARGVFGGRRAIKS